MAEPFEGCTRRVSTSYYGSDRRKTLVALMVICFNWAASNSCRSARAVDDASWAALAAASPIKGDVVHRSARLVPLRCADTNARPCDAEHPIFIPEYSTPWRAIFGGAIRAPAAMDKHVVTRVITPWKWLRMPTALILYRPSAAPSKAHPDLCTAMWCVLPPAALACVRAHDAGVSGHCGWSLTMLMILNRLA